MKRKLVYKVVSAFLLAAMLISLGPMDLRMVRAGDPPPPRGGIELTEAQRREIAQQTKNAGADDVFFPESRGDELVVGITKDGNTQYLVAWEEVVDGDQLSDDFPEVESPPPCPVPAIQAEQPFIGEQVTAGVQPCEEQAFAGIARSPSERPEQVRVLKVAFLDEETFEEALAIPEEQSLSKRLPLSGLFGVKPVYAQETHYFWHGSYVTINPSSYYWATSPLHLSAVDVDYIQDVGAVAIAALAGLIAVWNPYVGVAVGAILEAVWLTGIWCYRQNDGEMDIHIPWRVVWGNNGWVCFAGSLCGWFYFQW